MSQYIVSARKYRPDSFETLIGQDTIAKTLSNSIKRGQLAHAYLFCGPRGVGKTTTARIFAKMINCSNPGPDMEPCGECESCVSFKEGRSYCIHELDAASNNSVEDIKALMDQVQVPPQVGKYSVYIIDEVHMLSAAAFNAFLKTLEEPPAHAIFILATTEKHKILPTILSRCQTYDFNRISVHDTVRYLKEIAAKEGVDADDESLHVIATKADGAMRDALTIFDQSVAFCGNVLRKDDVIRNLGVLDYEYSFKMVDDFLAGNYADAFLAFDEILTKGFNALHFVASLSSHLRDLVVAKTGGLESLLDMPDSMKQRYAQQASKCSVQFLFDALGITTACESTYKSAVNPRLHIEYALMRLSHLVKVPATAPAVGHSGESVGSAEGSQRSSERPAVPGTFAPAKVVEGEKAAGDNRGQRPLKRSKTGSSLSLNSIMEEKKEEEKAEEKAVEEAGKLPEDALVVEKWKEMASQYADKPRLASTIANGTVNVREENATKIVDFVVKNEAQKLWIEEKLLWDLEGRLRGLLACNKVNIMVSVVPEEEVKKVPYMPEEKAKDLMDKNPDVRAFVADLGLDTK